MCGIYALGSTFPTMRVTQIVSNSPHSESARCRTASRIRRAALVLGAIGMMAGTAVVTAGPALASVGSEPGNVRFSPASGATKLTPTWSTTDGCPAGYRGSAQMSIFTAGGKFLSSISDVAYTVTTSFSGKLDGSMAAILKFAHVPRNGTLEFVIGCYSQEAATGSFKWMQSIDVTLSSDGTSYTTSSPAAGSSSGGSTSGSSNSGSAGGQQGSNGQAVSSTNAANTSGISSRAEVGLIGGSCVVVLALAGLAWRYRRRNRSRLM
jgi:hypothetical protein